MSRLPSVAACETPPAGTVLPLEFFGRSSDVVGADLIGKVIWRAGLGGGRLTEVEAYLPEDDPACHAANGPTRRNEAMFGPAGRIYVFLSYGMHMLLNIVCERESVGSAVLVRSFEPVGDTGALRRNREAHWGQERASGDGAAASGHDGPWLSRGPGRVGQALGIERAMDGLSLGAESGLYVIDDGARPEVDVTTRVGISRGRHLPLRYYLVGSEYVSR